MGLTLPIKFSVAAVKFIGGVKTQLGSSSCAPVSRLREDHGLQDTASTAHRHQQYVTLFIFVLLLDGVNTITWPCSV